MNYEEALAWLQAIPAFIPREVKDGETLFDLTAVTALLDRLGRPQDQLRYVHVAGTNGKGSTCAFLQSILMEGGYRTGLYTSPSIERFTERIRVNREEITPDSLARLTSAVRREAEEMERAGEGRPSEFEVVCSIAFLYFVEQKCDIVVLETGMGGELDATNVISPPLLSVITSISYDHTMVLGHTLAKIAGAKAGIIKKGSSVLLFPQKEEADRVIREACESRQVPLYDVRLPERLSSSTIMRQQFSLEDIRPVARKRTDSGYLPRDRGSGQGGDKKGPGAPSASVFSIRLSGPYQVINAAAALQAAALLADRGFRLPAEVLKRGLDHARWPGRFEVLSSAPWIIVDGSHNPEGARTLREALETYFPGRKIRFIAGVLADKDYPAIFRELLPAAEFFRTVTPDSPRALPAEELAAYLSSRGAHALPCSSLKQALDSALQNAREEDVIVSFGSLYFTGPMRQLARR